MYCLACKMHSSSSREVQHIHSVFQKPFSSYCISAVPRAVAVFLLGAIPVIAEAIGRVGVTMVRPDYSSHNRMDNSLNPQKTYSE